MRVSRASDDVGRTTDGESGILDTHGHLCSGRLPTQYGYRAVVSDRVARRSRRPGLVLELGHPSQECPIPPTRVLGSHRGRLVPCRSAFRTVRRTDESPDDSGLSSRSFADSHDCLADHRGWAPANRPMKLTGRLRGPQVVGRIVGRTGALCPGGVGPYEEAFGLPC
jgi:hypothetical protein